jgi:DNA-binding YbaB/EbfC family protein
MLQMEEERVPLIEYEYMVENYWYYRFLSPMGDILDEGETPYSHGEHPYVVRAFPLVDGEIHPFVADVIDQQRYINHYIILNDFLVKSSAKGTLIVDESSIPADMSLEDVAEEWTKYNGVIKLRLKDGAKVPQQMVNQSKVAGLQDMITLQMQLMDDVSGVHGALQGKNATAGTSGILYEQQANNASTSIIDMLETFSAFLGASAKKKLKNIQQFYDEQVTIKVAGRNAVVTYDPETMGGVDFDVALNESYDTPVFRAITNEMLMQLLNAQQITLKQFLEAGSFPFADRLLQMVESNEQQMAQMQAMQREMDKVQEEIEQMETTATSGGGAVTVTVTGKKEIKDIQIQPEVCDPDDIEMLQDLILAAANEALRQMEEISQNEMSKFTSGLGIPGL